MTTVNNLELRQPKHHPLREFALTKLSQTIRDEVKIALRSQELALHPERRIAIDVDPLKAIIDYDEFLCHPDCSIARNEAVNGSDIDIGLVVLDKVAPAADQLRFINALRSQGFSVYHEIEVEAGGDVLSRLVSNGAGVLSPEVTEAGKELTKRKDQIISFETRDMLESEISPDSQESWVYLAGYKIGN
jgi:hypothetical protein